MPVSAPVFAYLGPAGTYTHEAARAFAARLGIDEPALLECASFDEVFDAVDRGKCEFGVVAKENSLEGSVTATLDNFAFKSQASILGEHVLDIHHCLVLHPDAKLEDVTCVASHAQGLAQCRRFLAERLPGRATITTSSTAERDIEDHFGNQTLFALIGRQGHPAVFRGERYKTSLALFLQVNRAGTLNMILSEFAYAGIDLSMIQSRPTKQQLGDYMFFIEFEESANALAVQTALNCLRLKLREVKVLGSYPVD